MEDSDPSSKQNELPEQELTGSVAEDEIYADYEHEAAHDEHHTWVRIVGFFFGTDLVICTLGNYVHYFQGLKWLFIYDALMALLTFIFVGLVWKQLKPLLRWKSFSWPKAVVYCFAAVLFAIAVNLLIKWFNKTIFHQDIYFYKSFRQLLHPKLVMVVVVAIFPAFFEELAYRGLVLEGLFHLADRRQAIIISAFFFAVIHMSFISFFWLMPFAIWLANIRSRENTIWYGIMIHFCFNMTALLIEFYELHLFHFPF